MNHRQRFVRTLTGKPVDRVPFIKVFGGTNAIVPRWEEEYPGIGERVDALLGFEGEYRGWLAAPVDLTPVGPDTPEVLEDTATRRVVRRGDGKIECTLKTQDFGYHVLEFPVKTRDDWTRYKDRFILPERPERFGDDWSAFAARHRARTMPVQLTHRGVYGVPRTLMGDEALGYAFYDDPDMVHDMMNTYTDLALDVWETMCAQMKFDLIECWEDMASKNGAFISPTMFREFMKPQYRRIRAFADAHDIEIVLVDSDGYIDDLTGLMIEAGVTAMYPYEVQSGCDVVKMLRTFPALGVIGGLNKNVMAHGREAIDGEMERARDLIRRGRFIPGPDHFVLSDVSWENYRYFMEQLRDVVMTTTPAVDATGDDLPERPQNR